MYTYKVHLVVEILRAIWVGCVDCVRKRTLSRITMMLKI